MADGQLAFAKLNHPDLNQRSCQLYVDELAVYGAIASLPGVPRPQLLATVREAGWVGLVLSLAPGSPPGPPWRADAVQPVADALTAVAAHHAPPALPSALERLPDLDGWAVLATEPPGPIDPWDRAVAPRCAAIVEGWRDWTSGTALQHQDNRCDNALVTDDGQVTLVDWNFACAGAPWLDHALLAADVVGSGVGDRPDDESCVRRAVELATSLLQPGSRDAARFVVALAGMLRRNSLLDPVEGLPTFRAWQSARADRLRPLVAALLPQFD